MIIPYHSQQDVIKNIITNLLGDEETYSYINSKRKCITYITNQEKTRKPKARKTYCDLYLMASGLVSRCYTKNEEIVGNYYFNEEGSLTEEYHNTIINSKLKNGRFSDFLYYRKYYKSKIIFESRVNPYTNRLHNPFGPALFDSSNNYATSFFWDGKNLGYDIVIPEGGMTEEFVRNLEIMK